MFVTSDNHFEPDLESFEENNFPFNNNERKIWLKRLLHSRTAQERKTPSATHFTRHTIGERSCMTGSNYNIICE